MVTALLAFQSFGARNIIEAPLDYNVSSICILGHCDQQYNIAFICVSFASFEGGGTEVHRSKESCNRWVIIT